MKIREIKKLRLKIPKFKGRCGKCNECCQSPILMNFSELVEIKKKFGDHARNMDKSLCPWYDTLKKRCAVYDERPLICRMFGLEKGSLTCSYNKQFAIFDNSTFFKITGNKYFEDSGLPKIITEHFNKNIIKIRGFDKFKIFKL